jgi:hypothetical protein
MQTEAKKKRVYSFAPKVPDVRFDPGRQSEMEKSA